MKLDDLINQLMKAKEKADDDAEVVIDVFNENNDCCHTFFDMEAFPCDWENKQNVTIHVNLK